MANITRCFFWLGQRFDSALLWQSIFMILAQVSVTRYSTRRPFSHVQGAHSWCCYSSAYCIAPKQARIPWVHRQDQCRSGSGPPIRNTSNFLQRLCQSSGVPYGASYLLIQLMHSLCQAILFLIFGRSKLYVAILGYVALGLESTLPIPQFYRYAYSTQRVSVVLWR